MNYEDWAKAVPIEIGEDPLWRVAAYRLALFAADLGWGDVTRLMGDKRTLGLSNQLYRAVGSMGANIFEGDSRGTGKDRARFFEASLGSARESRGWDYSGRFVLGEKVVAHRLKLCSQIIRLLLKMVTDQRGSELREDSPPYFPAVETIELDPVPGSEAISVLLQNAPLP